MIGPTCEECGWIHLSDDAYAVGRFNAGGPAGYIARGVDPAVLRATRAEADLCAIRKAKREAS
ncbi:MAG: hypothetical protein J7518_22455 [Nocardioidaceae bacterium]|nr:hypothetical protein [Nocardioidaceae bacterium]